ncbi:hypothetical protein BDY21DRAFT_213862 [Lineolata rhizophorae]|uniref:Uncharacterized protein n=1 Tax=Lineolata rhizophorae TaxID=578093 RepID=A0A6A6P2T0_9PEZI|nr:hypothetical protein BDY21DRAFT_213862 [Lineolata rhizophorae]
MRPVEEGGARGGSRMDGMLGVTEPGAEDQSFSVLGSSAPAVCRASRPRSCLCTCPRRQFAPSPPARGSQVRPNRSCSSHGAPTARTNEGRQEPLKDIILAGTGGLVATPSLGPLGGPWAGLREPRPPTGRAERTAQLAHPYTGPLSSRTRHPPRTGAIIRRRAAKPAEGSTEQRRQQHYRRRVTSLPRSWAPASGSSLAPPACSGGPSGRWLLPFFNPAVPRLRPRPPPSPARRPPPH